MSDIFNIATKIEAIFARLDEVFCLLSPTAKRFKFKSSTEIVTPTSEEGDVTSFHDIADEFTRLVETLQVLVKSKHASITKISSAGKISIC